jgi:uncharacterized protein (DUF934 family)
MLWLDKHGHTVAATPSASLVPLCEWDDAGSAAGVFVDGHADEAIVAQASKTTRVIVIDIPKFTDGRAYTLAYSLRQRYGFRGLLVARGDVLRDQAQALLRVGFDAFAVNGSAHAAALVAGLRDFSQTYQTSADAALPVFRQRGDAAPRGASA